MADRLSITWSNRHQEYLDEMLLKALRNGHLKITSSVEFSFSDEFYDDGEARYFMASIPKDMMNEMIGAWIKKSRCEVLDYFSDRVGFLSSLSTAATL